MTDNTDTKEQLNAKEQPNPESLNSFIQTMNKEEADRKSRITPFMDRKAALTRPNNYKELATHSRRKYSNLHFNLPDSEIPPGLRYGRFKVYDGNVISTRLIQMQYSRGWTAVPASRHPSLQTPDLGSITSSVPREYILIGDTMLMQRPIEDHQADMEDFAKTARNKTQYAQQAALNNGTTMENHRQIKSSLSNSINSFGN